ncbi:MAG: LysM peptidoglycan-binding domain-containing protein [Anaerolineae bacterium]|nr:LysM peptidoglycan-binding domain-containing protein [Thermoflexus sp.]MDW8065291.1 LysM peptidoglycan-binding domain-containing protein [Anaerolineae bacterium]
MWKVRKNIQNRRICGNWLWGVGLNTLAALGALILAMWALERVWPIPPLPTLLPTLTPAPTRTPRQPFTYTVQPGDTLSLIAARFQVSLDALLQANRLHPEAIIYPGQVLWIPVDGFIPSFVPSSFNPTATLPPLTVSREIDLRIRQVKSPGDLSAESLVLVNEGTTINLAGWRIRDEEGNQYIFPALTIWQGSSVTVHTREGRNSATDLYWGRSAAVWRPGERGILEDPEGKPVLEFRVTVE